MPNGVDTALFAGTATWEIPIVVPPGTGGAQPDIVLRYDSGTVDARGNRDQAQPTGLGWTLDVGGYILRDDKNTLSTGDDTFALVFGGVRYTLVLVDAANRTYHTKDETFWRIQYQPTGGGDDWTLTTRTGVAYRFGSTPDSRAYALNANRSGLIAYQYLLSEKTLPDGPTVRYAYHKQSATASGYTYDQAAYPDTITYSYATATSTTPVGGVTRQVQFVREDRLDYTDVTASAGESFHQRFRIREILAKVDTRLVRKYTLAYDYSIDRDTAYTWGGAATGDLTLTSVTQWGDGAAASLPPLSFQYANARLSRVNNGIGGAIAWTYERMGVPIYAVQKGTFFTDWAIDNQPSSLRVDAQLLGYAGATTSLGDRPLYLTRETDLYPGSYAQWQAGNYPGYGPLGYAFSSSRPGALPLWNACLSWREYGDGGGIWCNDHGPSNSTGGWEWRWLGYLYSAKVDRYRVTSRTVEDGRTPAATTTFAYGPIILSDDGREFYGHSWVRAVAPTGHYTVTSFLPGDAFRGRASRVDVYAQNGPVTGTEPLFRRTDYTWTVRTNTAYPGATFAALTSVDDYTYDGDASARQTRTVYSYDHLGNVTRIDHHGDVATTGDERTIAFEYFPNETDWIIALPASRTVGAGATLLAATRLYYDQTTSYQTPPVVGNLQQREDWLDTTGTYVSTGWTYDAYGNVLTQTSARGFTTTVTYDATATYPGTLTSPLAGTPAAQLVTTYTYDTGLGVLQGVIDPNGQPTNYQYDAFGRLTAITNALDETTTVAYENLGTVGSQKTTVSVPDGTGGNIWRSNYFDGLGRTFKVEREGANGTVIVESVKYDARGLVSTVSLPRFSTDTEYRATHTYDPLGRMTLRELPDNASEAWAYNDWTTTYTNPQGFSWVYVADAYGRIERVREPVEAGGTPPETVYTYDPLDRLRGVTDALGRVTTLQYDTLGRRTALTDPTLGAWSYQYDANGNPIARTDAKGQGVTFQYDGLDRLVQKTYPDGRRIEFEYRNDQDPAIYARGRLRRAVDYSSAGMPSVAKEYEYDELGRVKALTRVIDNLSYRSELTYTPFGAFKTVRYPDGEVLTYTYDAAGQVSQVVGMDDIPRTYLESATYDAAGQPKQLRRYGGVVTDFTYSPTRQWLTAVRSTASTATLQDLVFGRDAVGNITSITNNVDRLLDQTFDDYDPLDRLRRAVGPYGTHTYTYDAVGNLLGKAGVTYAYGATAVGCGRSIPYAVASTSSGFSGTYDCNGNLLGDGERSFVWDPDDRPTSITHAAHGTTAFQYGPDGERVRKATSTKTVRYAGWLEDRVEENVIVKHVYAGGRRIATRLSSAGPESDVYVPLDNQIGSLHALVRGGQVVLTLGYLPFGESDPAHTTGSADWYQHRFTGQEQDPETELYYYGARYYNPKLGRFISPDPMVQDLYDPRSFNRWSYVRNNPIRYTDSSGYGIDGAYDGSDCAGCDEGHGVAAALGSDEPGRLGPDGQLVSAPDMSARVTYDENGKAYIHIGSPGVALEARPQARPDTISLAPGENFPDIEPTQIWRNPSRPALEPGWAGGPPRYYGPPTGGRNYSGQRPSAGVGSPPPSALSKSPNASQVPPMDMARQGKHIPGHPNYIPSRNPITVDPRTLTPKIGTGTPANKVPAGTPGYKERVTFDDIIGTYNGVPTRNGIVHYSKDGVHVVPARP